MIISYLFMLFISITTLEANRFKHELADDKAQHTSCWRAYAKSYAIDPEIQHSLQALVATLTTLVGVQDVTVRIAEANKLNTFLPKKFDCTNTDNAYSFDLFGSCKSITIGEDFINEGSTEELMHAIAHELAHIKNNDFTKRLIIALGCIATVSLMSFKQAATFASALAMGIVIHHYCQQQEQDADNIAAKFSFIYSLETNLPSML